MGESRVVLALALLAHGVAHGVGFAGPWGLVDPAHVTFSRDLLDGRLHVGSRTLKALGLGWLALGLAFVTAAIAVVARRSWGVDLALTHPPLSALMCVQIGRAHV